MGNKLIVVSIDALVYEDLEYLKTRPNFQKLLASCAQVKRVKSIYPTLTYPCHATMATGCFPTKHGVLNNTCVIPGVEDTPWLWYHDNYQCRDLIDAAKEKGLTTAIIGWPTMGNHPNADYIVAEVAGTKAKTAQEFRRDYLLTGTTEELWDAVGAPNVHYRTYHRCPHYFNTTAACDIIRLYAPDLVMVHLGEPDHARHAHGVFSPLLEPALDACEWALGQLMDAIERSGYAECTNLVITADHGHLDSTRSCLPNALFAENGFLTLDEQGQVTDWRAWCKSVGMSADVFVKNEADIPLVAQLLEDHLGQGYSKVFTRQDAAQEGYDGPFDFVLETDDTTRFLNGWTGPWLTEHGEVHGCHGYHPDKGPRPTILAMGPAFRQGVVLENAHLTDGAPTWATILGAELPDTDGKPILDILV